MRARLDALLAAHEQPETLLLAFEPQADQIVYYNGHLSVFTHEASDLASFRLFATQLIINGTASCGQIAKAFGIPARTLKRCAQRYRLRGAEAFFKPAAKRTGHRLTPERLTQVQALLDEGLSVPLISEQSGILPSTLHKAIDSGRCGCQKKEVPSDLAAESLATTKSQRSATDAQTPLGVGTARVTGGGRVKDLGDATAVFSASVIARSVSGKQPLRYSARPRPHRYQSGTLLFLPSSIVCWARASVWAVDLAA